jgi:hypothetical protein
VDFKPEEGQAGEPFPVPLAYRTPVARHRLSVRLLILGACIAATIGGVYCRVADWNAYVQSAGPDGQWRPKFEMPAAWQIAESSFVGLLSAAVLVTSWCLIRRRLRPSRPEPQDIG